jgi:hypothetical protein
VADLKKPLVNANLLTEYGEIEDIESFKAEGIAQHDYTYTPGFSEMRVNRELALGAYKRNEIRAGEVPTLPVNCRWFRTVKGTGSDPDQMRVAHAKNMGYRAVTKEDVGQAWLTAVPPGGMVAPDGTIKSAAGDLVLCVIGQQGAARNAMRKKIAAEASVDGLEMSAEGLGSVGKQFRGAEPTVTVHIGGTTK